MRRRTEKEDTKRKNERDARESEKEEKEERVQKRGKNEGSEREVSRTRMAGQRTIENIEQDGERCARGDVRDIHSPLPPSRLDAT